MTATKPKRTAEAHRALQEHAEKADKKSKAQEQRPMQAGARLYPAIS